MTQPSRDEPNSPGRLLAFCSIAMPLAAIEVPLTTYLPPLYASAFGFGLPTLGLVFLLSRLWDAVIDPVVGALSDRTRTAFGRRKPWIAAGGVAFALFGWQLFFPAESLNSMELGAVLFAFYVGYSCIAIPFAAWSAELSSEYHERTRIAAYWLALNSLGFLLALILPASIDILLCAGATFTDTPRLRLAAMGLMAFVLLVPSLYLNLRVLPEPPIPQGTPEAFSVLKTLRLLLGEKLLLRVLLSNFAVRLAQGIRISLFVFFVAYFMKRPEWAPSLFLLQFVFGLCAAPIWLKVGRRIGKHRAAVTGEMLQLGINIGLVLLTPERFPALLLLTAGQGLAQGSGNLMLRAILADVADYHRLHTRQDRTGLFFSVLSLSDKTAFAVAIGIALPSVAFLGFDPQVTNTPQALANLQLMFALGPALGHLLAATLIHRFPLDERHHQMVRESLAVRDASS